nr:syntaxin-4-like isoform X1 [Taeniopygia guttata]
MVFRTSGSSLWFWRTSCSSLWSWRTSRWFWRTERLRLAAHCACARRTAPPLPLPLSRHEGPDAGTAPGVGLGLGGGGAGGGGRLLPPEDPALAQAQYLRSALGALSLRAAALERLQERALATPLPPPELQEDLQRVRDEIQDLTREIQAGLRGLEPSGSDSGPGSVRERLRRTQHGLLAQQFFGVTERLQTVQSRYRQRNLERIQRQLQIAGHAPLSEEELEQLLESGQTQIFVPNAAGAARAALDEAGTRHREIRRLERGLRELGELFRLLGSTVEAQGDVIDRIERHVQHSGAELGKGRSHLRGAGQRRRGARKKRLALAACASAAILVLAAIVAASVAAG